MINYEDVKVEKKVLDLKVNPAPIYWIPIIYDYLFNYSKTGIVFNKEKGLLNICQNCFLPLGKHCGDIDCYCPASLSSEKLDPSNEYESFFVGRDNYGKTKFKLDKKRTKLFLKLMEDIKCQTGAKTS